MKFPLDSFDNVMFRCGYLDYNFKPEEIPGFDLIQNPDHILHKGVIKFGADIGKCKSPKIFKYICVHWGFYNEQKEPNRSTLQKFLELNGYKVEYRIKYKMKCVRFIPDVKKKQKSLPKGMLEDLELCLVANDFKFIAIKYGIKNRNKEYGFLILKRWLNKRGYKTQRYYKYWVKHISVRPKLYDIYVIHKIRERNGTTSSSSKTTDN